MLDKLTNQDLFILGCLLILIALVGMVCLIMVLLSGDKKKKVKKQKIKKEKVKEEKKQVDINVSLATNDIPELSKEAPRMDEILNKKEEVKQVETKQEVVEKHETKSSIEDVLKLMNADLEKQKYENIDRYEEEQEENAVISYQELLDRKMALNEVKLEKEEKKEEAFIPKFSNSEFISPIFGRVEKKEEEIEMLDEDFLNNLKEFRSNL